MNPIPAILYGLFGAVIGSFLNVCILRIPEGERFVKGRSHCPACRHILRGPDMVPILSWMFLGGKCRYCHAPISIWYPAVEALTALVFILCNASIGTNPASMILCLFGCLLITAAFIDGRYMYIPDGIHLCILVLALAFLLMGQGPGLLPGLAGSALSGGFLALLCFLTKGGVGHGDIKLFLASGMLLGPGPSISAVFIGYAAAGLWYLIPLLRGRVGRKTRVAMAPFFALSLMICALWHHQLFHWYIGLFTRI